MSIDVLKQHFTKVYAKESDALFRFCVLRVSDRERALDLTQETFTRLWQSMVDGKSPKNPRAFLYVVARNLIIDWYRKVKSVSLESLYDEEMNRPYDMADEKLFNEIEINSDAKRALNMINNLEAQYREVLFLRYVADLPPKDIAEILGLNVNLVSVRITRGVKNLRKIMGLNT